MGKHETGYVRVERDFYPTPSWVVDALGEHVTFTGKHVWECACGAGDMSEALKAAGASVYSTDIEDRGYAKLDAVLDFIIDQPPERRFDALITNPPYGLRNKLAVKFIERGLQHIKDEGFLALLLPIDFDSAITRHRFFAGCPAFARKIVLLGRIVWFPCLDPETGRQKAPKENFAWYLWHYQPPRSRPPALLYASSSNGTAP
jgi:hypothetical protein